MINISALKSEITQINLHQEGEYWDFKSELYINKSDLLLGDDHNQKERFLFMFNNKKMFSKYYFNNIIYSSSSFN